MDREMGQMVVVVVGGRGGVLLVLITEGKCMQYCNVKELFRNQLRVVLKVCFVLYIFIMFMTLLTFYTVLR